MPRPLDTDSESTTRIGRRPSNPTAAVCADCRVFDSSPEIVMHTTPSAPASSARRKAAAKAPGDGHAVCGSSSLSAIRR